jgi:DNA sulfur modification protein DndE
VEHALPLGVLRVAAEATPPTPIDVPADSNVEMAWPVFAGEYQELYLALLKERLVRDGIELSEGELRSHF